MPLLLALLLLRWLQQPAETKVGLCCYRPTLSCGRLHQTPVGGPAAELGPSLGRRGGGPGVPKPLWRVLDPVTHLSLLLSRCSRSPAGPHLNRQLRSPRPRPPSLRYQTLLITPFDLRQRRGRSFLFFAAATSDLVVSFAFTLGCIRVFCRAQKRKLCFSLSSNTIEAMSFPTIREHNGPVCCS